jgi:hypothetical protein
MSLSRKTAQTVLGERRVVRSLVLQVHLAEPAVGQVQLDFVTELALRADAVAVADDEHPDHQLRIDRGAADVAIVGLELLVQVGERRRHEHVHPPQQVVLGYAIFQPELVEQPALIAPLPTHHHPPPLLPIDQPPESRFAGLLKPFFDSIGQEP